MKLLFEESGKLRDILGFVDADIDLSQIKSELYTATKDLISLIGKETYAYAVTLASKETPTDEESFSLYNFRYPIGVDAYRQYAPSGDLNHTNNGRKMRNEEYEKSPFEWMINRDNDALEKRYYKALDNLLDMLDEENPIVVPADGETPEVKWKDTEAFQKTHRLFVRSTLDFDAFFPINSRLLLLKLQPGLAACERFEILPRIGQEKFDLYKELLAKPDTEGTIDATLLELIKGACVFFAMAWAIKRLRVSLLPEGILQRYAGERVNTINTKSPEKLEAELTAQSFTSDALKELQAIETYLKPPPTEEELQEGNVIPGLTGCDSDKFFSS